ncbi:MAG TPA: extracellular solute-binding protein [Acholeplasmataceae bacterium]|nr:extracellular solute-binding protein [Acholeplasmataceae bacterium]
MKKLVIILLSLGLLLITYLVVDVIVSSVNQDRLSFNKNNAETIDISDLAYYDQSAYYQYTASHEQLFPEIEHILLMGHAYSDATEPVDVINTYEGKTSVLLTSDEGLTTWNVNIDEAGFYNLKLFYYPYPGKSSAIERALYINGEIPFEDARSLIFPRIWGNKNDVIQDIYQNDIRPSQVEKPMWTESYFKDAVGYIQEPYAFFLEEGLNTIGLEAIREPLMIEAIEISSVKERKTYDEIKAIYETNNYEKATSSLTLVETEDPYFTTSPTLYPLNDRTSPLSSPTSPTKIKLNTIGGNNWGVAGDKIAWQFTVAEDGLYEISMRVKQKLASGMNVGRNIYIDGEIPFKELESYAFKHDNNWRLQTLGTQDEPFLFYLEAGHIHTLEMEVSLGQYGPLIAQIQSSIDQLNRLYREILVYTGPEPDQYRDYQLTERIPHLVERLQTEKDNLTEVRQAIIKLSGSKSEKTGILDTILIQLEDFIEKPREIHKNLSNYNANVSSLGTLVILLNAHPLEIDYMLVHDSEADLPRSRANVFEKSWFNMRAFFSTFVTDYSSIGTTQQVTGDAVEVWLSIGKDQANVLRKLIDESFTPNTGIRVDLKLVNGAVLLPATLSGVGPDVAMGLGNSVPVNYAMRNASYDLTNFDDFDDISTRFMSSGLTPYSYEGGVYALPEQQIFLMLFYRTDIFQDLGLTAPDTWDDVIQMIPNLQKHNLEFYLPVPQTQGSVTELPPNPIFSTLFYQHDGQFYINNNRESGFNEGLGPMVFEMWTQFYTDYSFPVEANFVNRFRSGQMPVGITYYNTYNTLAVFAPEIRGKWDFIPVPGTEYEDELGDTQIRRETVSSGTGIMILNQSDKKDDAWEYLKWWTSTEIQVQYGREMEGILGAAARYPSANIEAMSQLPWKVSEYQKLYEQWQWVKGIPEVPGGYMTGRHLDNAFRLVYEDSSNPRETIYDYVQTINAEIEKKRREFGLD